MRARRTWSRVTSKWENIKRNVKPWTLILQYWGVLTRPLPSLNLRFSHNFASQNILVYLLWRSNHSILRVKCHLKWLNSILLVTGGSQDISEMMSCRKTLQSWNDWANGVLIKWRINWRPSWIGNSFCSMLLSGVKGCTYFMNHTLVTCWRRKPSYMMTYQQRSRHPNMKMLKSQATSTCKNICLLRIEESL